MVRTLIISSQPVVDGTVLAKLLQGGITTLEDISFVTNSPALPAQALPESAFLVAFSLAEDAGAHNSQLLAELYRSLKHSGTLTIIERDHKVKPCHWRCLLILSAFLMIEVKRHIHQTYLKVRCAPGHKCS